MLPHISTALYCHQEKLCIAILETYVKQLIEERQVALIATYTATLPQDLQIECYAKFLEGLVGCFTSRVFGLAINGGDLPKLLYGIQLLVSIQTHYAHPKCRPSVLRRAIMPALLLNPHAGLRSTIDRVSKIPISGEWWALQLLSQHAPFVWVR